MEEEEEERKGLKRIRRVVSNNVTEKMPREYEYLNWIPIRFSSSLSLCDEGWSLTKANIIMTCII